MLRRQLLRLIAGSALMTGDGLVPPLNAPPAGTLTPGVQPGVSQAVVVANRVIIYGAGSGMFIYNGTPGAGTLVGSATSTLTTADPYGNKVVAGAFATYANAAGIATVLQPDGLEFYTGSLSAGWTNKGILSANIDAPNLLLRLLAGGFGLTQANGTPSLIWYPPSGDVTGGTDAAAVNTLLGLGWIVLLMPGQYYGNVPVAFGPGQLVRGTGKEVTTWSNTGDGPAFLIENSGAYSTEQAALTGIHVDGTRAGAGACGIQAGDIAGLEIDAWVTNFTGGNNGVVFENAYWWTEQARVQLRIENCDGGMVLAQSGAGTNSFDRSEFDLTFIQNAGQEGIVFGGASSPGPVLLEGVLRIHGNFNTSATPVTSAVIKFVQAGASILQSRIEIGVECDSSLAYGPQTIYFGNADNYITNCTGVIEFFEYASNTFTVSNNSGNFWFDGPVLGDTTLLKNVAAPFYSHQVTSGFPAGWTGQVTWQIPRGDGVVIIDIQLFIAAGTVVTNGETVLTGVPGEMTPINDKVIPVSGNGSALTLVDVTNASDLTYFGLPFTAAAGGVYMYGQAHYLNSV